MKISISISSTAPKFDDFESAVVTKRIQTPHAYLDYQWKRDLLEEEDDDYLPPGYSPKLVIELSEVRVKNLKDQGSGNGYGKEVFDKFLLTGDVLRAELIYLDLNPDQGVRRKSDSEDGIMQSLQSLYRKWGFRNSKNLSRMWLVRKGAIPVDALPT